MTLKDRKVTAELRQIIRMATALSKDGSNVTPLDMYAVLQAANRALDVIQPTMRAKVKTGIKPFGGRIVKILSVERIKYFTKVTVVGPDEAPAPRLFYDFELIPLDEAAEKALKVLD